MGIAEIYPKTFRETITAFRSNSKKDDVRLTMWGGWLLCLDPGETTGWALFEDFELMASGQIQTKCREHAHDYILGIMSKHNVPTVNSRVVMEDYRMYGWKKDEHTFSKLHTPKLIGAFESVFGYHEIPYQMQMAVTAKTFATDDLLQHWGLWQKGERHARDAIRHGLYYLMFNKGEHVVDAKEFKGAVQP